MKGLAQAKVFTLDAAGAVSYQNGETKPQPPVKQVLPAKIPVPAKPVASPKTKPLPGAEERMKMVREALRKVPKNRPSRVATLRTFISDVFRQNVPDGAMDKTLKALKTAKVLTSDASGKVEYPE